MNSKHKIGLGKPQKHKLRLQAKAQLSAAVGAADERILRDQFWLPGVRSDCAVHPFAASGADSTACRVQAKKKY